MSTIEQHVMASANRHTVMDDTQKILMSFARTQLSHIDPKSIKKNSFELFSITAFLYGAIHQLGKQSTLPEQLINHYLHKVLIETFSLPAHNAEGLVSSIHRMMKKYYLLENIYLEGESAAEQWLVNEHCQCTELKQLLDTYSEFTLMDMNAAGMKSDAPAAERRAQIKPPVDKPSSAMFKLTVTTVVLGLLLGAGYYLNHYFQNLLELPF